MTKFTVTSEARKVLKEIIVSLRDAEVRDVLLEGADACEGVNDPIERNKLGIPAAQKALLEKGVELRRLQKDVRDGMIVYDIASVLARLRGKLHGSASGANYCVEAANEGKDFELTIRMSGGYWDGEFGDGSPTTVLQVRGEYEAEEILQVLCLALGVPLPTGVATAVVPEASDD